MARRRTWAGEQRAPWQWLYFALLTRVMGSGELRREVSVGRIPRRLDAALLGCVPSPDSKRHLPDILSRLWPCTLMEYKGPNGSLRAGELHHLVGGVWLALGTKLSHVHHSDVGLHVVPPTPYGAFREDAERAGASVRQEKPGVHVITGLASPCVALEARVLAGDNPALGLLDPSFPEMNQDAVPARPAARSPAPPLPRGASCPDHVGRDAAPVGRGAAPPGHVGAGRRPGDHLVFDSVAGRRLRGGADRRAARPEAASAWPPPAAPARGRHLRASGLPPGSRLGGRRRTSDPDAGHRRRARSHRR